MDAPLRSAGCALLRPFLLLSTLFLAAPLQSQTAADLPRVRDPVAPVDLLEIGRVLGECLNRNFDVAAQQVTGSGDQLTVDLGLHDDDGGPAERFFASLQFNEASGRWEPTDFAHTDRRVFPAVGGKPVSTRGLISPLEAESLHGAISDYWARHVGPAPIRIASITSSRRPQLSCRYDRLEPFERTLYEVAATGSTLPISSDFAPPPGSPRQIIDIPGPLAPLFVFRMREGVEGSPPEVLSVQCSYPARDCDRGIVAALQAGSAAPDDPLDDNALRAAMLAALPPVFRTAEIDSTQTLWSGTRETVVVGLKQVELSPLRKAGSMLQCSRFLSAPLAWNCRHRMGTQTQEIPALDVRARLLGDLDLTNAEVAEMVEKLLARVEGGRPQLLTLRSLPQGGYYLRFAAQGMHQAWFNQNLELERLE